MKRIELVNGKNFNVRSIRETLKRGTTEWTLDFTLVGNYNSKDLQENFIKENLEVIKYYNENEELTLLYDYTILYAADIYYGENEQTDTEINVILKKGI
jgi:hypothetical protein